jgi:hypothetical protein
MPIGYMCFFDTVNASWQHTAAFCTMRTSIDSVTATLFRATINETRAGSLSFSCSITIP